MRYRPAFLADEASVALLTTRATGRCDVFVAETSDGAIAGVAVALPIDGEEFYLDHLVVRDDMRGQGVGSGLLTYVADTLGPITALSHGIDGFYEANGFEKFGTVWQG